MAEINILKTYQSFYLDSLNALSPIYGKSEGSSIIKLLIEGICQQSRIDFLLAQQKPIPLPLLAKLELSIARLLKNEPLQYILGYTYFLNEKIFVNPSVLIPREDTANWLNKCIEPLTSQSNLQCLDCCTGSGCMAIYLKKKLPQSYVAATDISPQALNIAKKNADFHNLEIDFFLHDLISDNHNFSHQSFDLIVCNPPYIDLCNKNQLAENVIGYEPHIALFANEKNPLLYYSKIISLALSKLKKGGKLIVEIDSLQQRKIVSLFKQKGYNFVETIEDFNNKARAVLGVKK